MPRNPRFAEADPEAVAVTSAENDASWMKTPLEGAATALTPDVRPSAVDSDASSEEMTRDL
jgi:hypothetical protein